MWWKLVGLLISTALLVLAVIPIRSHAVLYDPARDPPPRPPSFATTLGNMYLTPGAGVLVVLILICAGFAALKVGRGQW
jgi:hypothetical protein